MSAENPSIGGGADRQPELPSGIHPNIHDEFSKLEKVLVVPTPAVITSFTDIIVSPIHAKTVDEGPKIPVFEHLGAPERHSMLLAVLQNEGVQLVYSHVTAVKEGHTPLFTRDVGVVIDDKVIPSRLRYPYRSVEVQGLIDVLDPSSIVRSDRDYMIEGGDVAMLAPNLVLVGIGPRTNAEALSLLRETFPQKEFIPVLPVEEDKAFHIDTVMGILGEKKLVYLPRLVPDRLVSELKERGFEFAEANPDEYFTCSTNVLAVSNNRVISAAENKKTNANIRNLGVEVIEVPLEGILSQGGGPHCLTLPLVRS